VSQKNNRKFAVFQLITQDFLQEIEETLQDSQITNLSILVAFVTKSGAMKLIEWIRSLQFLESTARVITGTYLEFTHPDALEMLLKEKNIDIRVIESREQNLHAKAFFFESNSGEGIIFIGSSNLTLSALKKNIEWNVKLSSFVNPDDYQQTKESFEELWKVANSIDIKWLTNYRLLYKYSNTFDREREEVDVLKDLPIPRYAQPEALDELERTRRLGYERALIVLATGLGKTHLAAFDSNKYRKVLFIAHVREILNQAERIFQDARRFGKTGQFSQGWHTREISDVLFVTIQKISRTNTLSRFEVDEFDYIIIDEFHHARAKSYLKVLNYFEPQFLLGLTATPFRMDRKDITVLCDENIPYSCNLTEAINNNWLSPFKYYGIYDQTVDYQEIPWKRGRGYDQKVLSTSLNIQQRAEFVLHEYQKKLGDPTVGFCVSIGHANYMTQFFNEKGIPSLAVHSGKGAVDPGTAKMRLKLGDIKVIFAVDVFNEGVDLPNIQKIMLLRPTESMTIFIQQVGRGLRKSEGKEHLTILDFIGNYKKAYSIPAILTGRINPHIGREVYREILEDQKQRISDPSYQPQYFFPANCEINFELEVIENMIEKLGTIDPIRQAYIRRFREIKKELGERPSIKDMMNKEEIIHNYITAFGSWWNFLREMGELTEKEQGYHKKRVQMLAWLERVPIYTILGFELVRFVMTQDVPTIPLSSCIEYFKNWIGISEERKELFSIEIKNFGLSEENPYRELIEKLIIKKRQRRQSGWSIITEETQEFLKLDNEVHDDDFADEINMRLRMRRKEFHNLIESLKFGALYTKKEVKEFFRVLGATENIDHFFGPRSAGMVRLESLKILVLFVTIDKHPQYASVQQDYADELTSQTTIDWESQNITTQQSLNGRIITEKEPGYQKLMFIRLRAQDKYYGNSFFYLGRVNCLNYEDEKPIKVTWQFEKEILLPVYEYLTKPHYRKYFAKDEFMDELATYS
jgi:superfamily II DNA or RNA helicase